MNYRQLQITNIWTITLYALAVTLSNITPSPIADIPVLIVGIFIALFLSGANITYLMTHILKLESGYPLLFSLHILNTLFIPPAILLLLNQLRNRTDSLGIFAVYGAMLLIPTGFSLYRQLRHTVGTYEPAPLNTPKLSKRALTHPLTLAIIIIAAVHLSNILAYPTLPAPDTYSWLLDVEDQIQNTQVIKFTEATFERSLFAILSAGLHTLTQTTLYDLFKYVMPLLSLLTLAPLWLIASRIPGYLSRLVILLAPLLSSTLILELETTRQQIIFLWFLFFTIGIAYHAHLTKQSKLTHLLAIYIIIGLFYHPMFSVYLIAWLTALVLHYRQTRIRLKYIAPLAVLLLLSGRLGIAGILGKMYESSIVASHRIVTGNWNLAFPAAYQNIDGTNVGWPGITGIFQYYGYYVGPVTALVTIMLLVWLLRKKRRPNQRQSNLALQPSILLIILFITITELLPRIANYAYLPDRAWQYLGILLVLPGSLLLQKFWTKPLTPLLLLLVLMGYAINVVGASIINFPTKYIIPDYELSAASWIKANTPEDRLLLTATSRQLVRYHARSDYTGLPIEAYTDPNPLTIPNKIEASIITEVQNKHLMRIEKELTLMLEPQTQVLVRLEQLASNPKFNQFDFSEYIASTKEVINSSTILAQAIRSGRRQWDSTNRYEPLSLSRPLYVYFARTHPQHPYLKRAYRKDSYQTPNITDFPVLDGNPELYTRVYEDGDNVIVWQVNQLRQTTKSL